MAVGTVKWFNNAKGWGFIRIESGPDIFVHYSQIEGDGFRTLREGEPVEFELRDGPRGQFAEHVSRSDPPPPDGDELLRDESSRDERLMQPDSHALA